MAAKHEGQLAPHLVGVNPDYTKVEEGGYQGVSPEYQNAAVETDEPAEKVDGDQVAELQEAGVNNQWELSQGDDDDADGDEGGDDEKVATKKVSAKKPVLPPKDGTPALKEN